MVPPHTRSPSLPSPVVLPHLHPNTHKHTTIIKQALWSTWTCSQPVTDRQPPLPPDDVDQALPFPLQWRCPPPTSQQSVPSTQPQGEYVRKYQNLDTDETYNSLVVTLLYFWVVTLFINNQICRIGQTDNQVTNRQTQVDSIDSPHEDQCKKRWHASKQLNKSTRLHVTRKEKGNKKLPLREKTRWTSTIKQRILLFKTVRLPVRQARSSCEAGAKFKMVTFPPD